MLLDMLQEPPPLSEGAKTGLLLLLLFVYLLPTIVAVCRGHPSLGSIIVVNLFLGWSLLGWVLPLAWACGDRGPRSLDVTISHRRSRSGRRAR
jgi:hypothetical protein